MAEFTQAEIDFIRFHVEKTIKEKTNMIKTHEKHWKHYNDEDKEWATYRIEKANEVIDQMNALLSKLEK